MISPASALPGGDDVQNFVKRMHFVSRTTSPSSSLSVRNAVVSVPGTAIRFPLRLAIVARLAGHHHGTVIVSHAGPARTQGVLVGDERVAMQADGRQLELAAERPAIERLDVLQRVLETIPTRCRFWRWPGHET